MMPLSNILRKSTDEYNLTKSKKTINHLMFMDDIKQFIKNEKRLETLIQTARIYSQNIRME